MRSSVLVSALVIAALVAITSAGPAIAAPSAHPGSVPAQGSPPLGGLGLRLVDAPTGARDDPRAQQYIVDHLSPGAVIVRRIEVSNTSADPMSVTLYPAAARITGGSFAGDEGRARNDPSSWTSLSQDRLELAPGAVATDTVTVTVPLDAAPGEQYAVVWAEIGGPTTSGISLVNRVGIRMYLSIGGGNAPASSFTVDSLTTARAVDGTPAVLAKVHNTGGRALDLSGTLSLTSGPGSLSAGPFPAQVVATLAPGESGTVTVPLDKQLPDGPWNADLSVTSGTLEQSYQATITFPSGPGTADAVAAQTTVADIPWLLISVVGLILVLAVGSVVVITRRRRSSDTARHGS